MTNFGKIKSMTEEEFAKWLCKCVILDDPDEEMRLYGYGEFLYEEDVVEMLKQECV